MAVQSKERRQLNRAIVYGLLIAGSIVMLFPLMWTLSTALKTIDQLMIYPPEWIPNPVKWSNFIEALQVLPFHLYFKNTMIIVLTNLAAALLSSSLVAYGFARIGVSRSRGPVYHNAQHFDDALYRQNDPLVSDLQ